MVVDGLVLPRTWWLMDWFYTGHGGWWTGSTQDSVVDILVLPRTVWLMDWFYPGKCGWYTGSTQDMVVDGLVLPRTWWLMDWFYPGHGGWWTGSTQDMVVNVTVTTQDTLWYFLFNKIMTVFTNIWSFTSITYGYLHIEICTYRRTLTKVYCTRTTLHLLCVDNEQNVQMERLPTF